jgi:hypothetical protein
VHGLVADGGSVGVVERRLRLSGAAQGRVRLGEVEDEALALTFEQVRAVAEVDPPLATLLVAAG